MARIFIRAIIAYAVWSLVILGIFAVVALLVDGRRQAGIFHSGAVAVLLLAPAAWALAF